MSAAVNEEGGCPSGAERGELEILPDGYGFIRLTAEALGYQRGDPQDDEPYPAGHRDIYVAPSRIRAHRLGNGDQLACNWRSPKSGERYRSAVEITEINGQPAGPAT